PRRPRAAQPGPATSRRGGRSWVHLALTLVHAQPLEELAQVVARDAGFARGAAEVAVGLFEQTAEIGALERVDQLLLAVFERHVEQRGIDRLARGRGHRLRLVATPEVEVARLDDAMAAQVCGALDHVLELTDVAGELEPEQGVARGRAELRLDHRVRVDADELL